MVREISIHDEIHALKRSYQMQTRLSDDQIIAVVQAHKEGKKIQWSYPIALIWEEMPPVWDGRWDFKTFIYRVAPEPSKPREWNLVYKGSGTFRESSCEDGCMEKVIRVREIIE